MKMTSLLDSHQEGGRSTKGTSYLLEDRKYIPCTCYMSHSEMMTCFWLISLCHPYGTDDLDTSAKPTSHTYLGRIHLQTFILGPPILRALPVWQTSSHITPTSAPREVCDPMSHHSLGGTSYFVNFIDDSTRKVWAYPIRTKDRVFSIFSDWLTMVENQFGRKLKCLRIDNGGEFKSEEFVKFCQERSIRREYTAPYVRSRMELLNA